MGTRPRGGPGAVAMGPRTGTGGWRGPIPRLGGALVTLALIAGPARSGPPQVALAPHGPAEVGPNPAIGFPQLDAPGIDDDAELRRIVVGDADGRVMVARVLGVHGREVVALLPDGQLGWPEGLVPTDRPFRPATAEDLRRSLLAGPYRGFQAYQTDHYLVVSQGSPGFAAASAQLLESLYRGLSAALAWDGILVREAEFPLVAIIYATERDFRARHDVPPDVQAFYHVVSNRIYFFESSERDQAAPEVAGLRRPQTVAHEGTHQVLQNIGVQPRLAAWPAWLSEGLAEYCAPTSTDRRGRWDNVGKVNPFHMATFRDLADAGRDRRPATVEALVTRPDLSPTDYARAWALTHYLLKAKHRDQFAHRDQFVAYLKRMGKLRPLERRSPAEYLADFRTFFGRDLDRKVVQYVSALADPGALPYYAVVFAQPMPDGPPLRSTLVSQSPSMIRQWLDSMTSPHGGAPSWYIEPCPSRASASYRARGWLNGP